MSAPRDLDLSAREDQTAEAVAQQAPLRLAVAPYDPRREREGVRGWIAKALFWLIVAILGVLGLALLLKGIGIGDVEKFVATLLTPVLTLFGAVMGFYFGERATEQRRRDGGEGG